MGPAPTRRTSGRLWKCRVPETPKPFRSRSRTLAAALRFERVKLEGTRRGISSTVQRRRRALADARTPNMGSAQTCARMRMRSLLLAGGQDHMEFVRRSRTRVPAAGQRLARTRHATKQHHAGGCRASRQRGDARVQVGQRAGAIWLRCCSLWMLLPVLLCGDDHESCRLQRRGKGCRLSPFSPPSRLSPLPISPPPHVPLSVNMDDSV